MLDSHDHIRRTHGLIGTRRRANARPPRQVYEKMTGEEAAAVARRWIAAEAR